MTDNKTTRVADVIVKSIAKNKKAQQGAYKGLLDVINVTELSSNKGININLRHSEPERTAKWESVAKTGNVLRVHITQFNGGKEFVDRLKGFEVVDIKEINSIGPVHKQEPMRAFTDPKEYLDLTNGIHYDKITRAQEKIREAMLTIKHAQEEIDDSFKIIKSDSI
jgi:hypothetical protein